MRSSTIIVRSPELHCHKKIVVPAQAGTHADANRVPTGLASSGVEMGPRLRGDDNSERFLTHHRPAASAASRILVSVVRVVIASGSITRSIRAGLPAAKHRSKAAANCAVSV